MKKILSVFIVIALLCVNVSVLAQDKISIFINQEEIEFAAPPVIIEGRTLVPLRGLFEIYGFNVGWTDSTKTVIAVKESIVLVLQIDNTKVFVNNAPTILDVPPMLIGSSTMVPLRFVSEIIDLDVEWIEETNSIYINKKL